MTHLIDEFTTLLHQAHISHVISVPDGYLAPLIKVVNQDNTLVHIPAAREEEALGIASGIAMAGKTPFVMMQNSGILNSLGCYATLCQNYRIGFVILLSHRGNVFDQNNYDIPKIRFTHATLTANNVLMTSWYQYRQEKDLLLRVKRQAEVAREPVFLLLDTPPQNITF